MEWRSFNKIRETLFISFFFYFLRKCALDQTSWDFNETKEIYLSVGTWELNFLTRRNNILVIL